MVSFNYILVGNLLLILPFLLAIYFQKLEWLIIVAFFLLSNKESLLLTFGLYFIFQHSRIGWMHLKNKLKHSHFKMFKNALPFNIGAIFLYLIAIYIWIYLPIRVLLIFLFFFLQSVFPMLYVCIFSTKKIQLNKSLI